MGLGNLLCQMITDKKNLKTADYKRVTKYVLFGFVISVRFLYYFLVNILEERKLNSIFQSNKN